VPNKSNSSDHIGARGAAERVLPGHYETMTEKHKRPAGASTSVLSLLDAFMHNCSQGWPTRPFGNARTKTGSLCLGPCEASVTLGVPYQLVILSEGWLVGWFPCCRGGRLSILWRSTHPIQKYYIHTDGVHALPPPSPRAAPSLSLALGFSSGSAACFHRRARSAQRAS